MTRTVTVSEPETFHQPDLRASMKAAPRLRSPVVRMPGTAGGSKPRYSVFGRGTQASVTGASVYSIQVTT
jgi:hypothetical protein